MPNTKNGGSEVLNRLILFSVLMNHFGPIVSNVFNRIQI